MKRIGTKEIKKAMMKNDMKQEGIMRDAQKNPDGSFSDLILYSVLATD